MFRRAFILLPILAGVWWVLSGHAAPLTLGLGVGSVLLVGLTCPNLPAAHPRSVFGFLLYAPWLLSRIVLANLHVARLVLSPLGKLNPKLFQTPAILSTTRTRVLYGQSITLTPGTITVRIDESTNSLLVHRLDKDSAGDITSGAMAGKIAQWVDRGGA